MNIRTPAVAGMFYPASSGELSAIVDGMLGEVPASGATSPKALVVPHAGYIYSGPTAAVAYQALTNRQTIRHVVLLGPVHRVPVRGLALPDAEAYATPLGLIPLDIAAMQGLTELPQVVVFDAAHQQEHSLEVQLPFLQRVLEDFTLLPLAVGDASPAEVAEVLACLWGDDDTLILISSDLSHYHPYGEARRLDAATADAIRHLRGPISHQQACGATAVNGMLQLASERQMSCRLLDLRNSGDTAGDRERVVGYGALAFYEAAKRGAGDA
ncbi:MAG: AmmeMemoRadiSam system protein B [Mariprofundaceae bacterium]|nr:AmmeMemoRadiSam system protein B [Mariprofundaceae bacterium]